MKVAVTFDLTDDELIALNLMDNGKMIPAKRIEARAAIEDIVEATLSAAVPVVREQRARIQQEIQAALGVSANDRTDDSTE